MKASRGKGAGPRVPRRWRTPPPLTRGSEPLEGIDLLREVDGDVGLLLWQAYRNVMFWAAVEEGERGQLFAPGAGGKRRAELVGGDLPAPLAVPLETVAELLDNPGEISGERVSGACGAVSSWADAEGHEATALSFMQAAAVSAPRNAALALAVGRLARRRGEMPRAETWFRHAIMIGRQTGDWTSYSLAYIALGNMFIRRGNFPAAQRMHIKALRAARRKGLSQIQGMALHDLFSISVETGRGEQAEEYARQAFRAYGAGHPRLPALAHDVAYFWMERGHFERALAIFQALAPHLDTPPSHLVLVASLARAAAGVGQREAFRRAWVEVTRISKEPGVEAVVPACMLELALGATSLGEWDRAEQAAREAHDLAASQGQGKVKLRAESLLESVRSGRGAEARTEAARAPSAKGDALAGDFLRSLESAMVGARG